MKIYYKLILYFFLTYFFCSSHYLNASTHDHIVASLDIAKPNSLFILNKYLEKENLLDKFRIRERILSLSYDNLNLLLQEIKKRERGSYLSDLVEDVLYKKKKDGIYNLVEDIYINNRPVLLPSPFYYNESRHINALKPYEERLYMEWK